VGGDREFIEIRESVEDGQRLGGVEARGE